MKNYDFELIFKVPNVEDISTYSNLLFENGCDDVTINFGQLGFLALSFSREAIRANEAVKSAIKNVLQAIPNAKLIEASPDIVSISDIASILGYSSQYIRKLFETNLSYLPTPIHIGNPSIWHLSEILNWLKDIKKSNKQNISDSLFETASITREVNISSKF
ncbi:hypothetical protein AAX29_00630 [Aliarcobacter thereius]|uniref:DNA-binding protein n=1 Tax=Aliarcobacter thereius TaxID=544718 RepID=A0A1C0B7J6_9BACT|nr:hypothetical protein [Aliarcobacter thereius]OCL99585.1 hypothetical protein AAX29_00630 [Aliarcobacter thereius]